MTELAVTSSRRLARTSFVNFVGLGIGSLLQFAMVIVMSRGLRAAQVGIIFECIAVTKILTVIATLGLDFTAARSIALARTSPESMQSGRSEVGLAVWLTGLVGVAVAVGAALLASNIAVALGMPRLSGPLEVMSPVIVFSGVEAVLIAATRGLGSTRPYVLVDQLLDGFARLLAVTLGIAVGLSTAGIAAVYAGSAAITLIGAGWCARRLVTFRVRLPAADVKRLLTFTTFQWGAEIATVGLLWLDTILLAIWRPAVDVGIYSVATRTILLGTVFVTPVLLAFQPQIGRALSANDTQAVRELYRYATRLALFVGGPPFIFLAVFGAGLLRVTYGPEYAAGSAALAALAIGQVVNAGTGPCGYLVTMAGRSDQMLVTMLGAVGGNVLLNYLLIPPFGMTGAGVAWGVAVGGSNLARLYFARRTLGGTLPSEMWDYSAVCYVGGFSVLCLVVRFATASAPQTLALAVALTLCGCAYLGILRQGSVFRDLGIAERVGWPKGTRTRPDPEGGDPV